jgi:hypothetical protein
MSATMLQLIQRATGEMGLSVPASVAGNQTQDVVQQLALLNAVGNELARQHDWQALSKAYTFTTAFTSITGDTVVNTSNITNASSIVGIDTTYQVTGLGINQACFVASAPTGTTIPLSQPATSSNTGATYTLSKVRYAMPSDYDRQIDNTHWDKSKHWVMLGPESAQQWEWLISGYISTGPRVRYRIFGNLFQIWPALGTADTLGFEYVSNAWAASSAGTAQTTLTADADTCIFPDVLMVLGLKNKYFQVKGLGPIYQEDYDMQLSIAKSNDAGSATLSFAPRASDVLIGWANIPDSTYGS